MVKKKGKRHAKPKDLKCSGQNPETCCDALGRT